MNSKRHERQSGFTLVEIMVVVVILGLLATTGTIAVRRYLEDAKFETARTRCAELEQAIESYTLTKGDVDPEDVFETLIEEKYIKNRKDIKDPWGEDFIVRRDDDGNYQVISRGPDKTEDSEDDIDKRGKLSESEDF